jgi:SPP1 gp7 family putative phage head morphogenesis protein
MITNKNVCFDCARFHETLGPWTCDAFPNGIPDKIFEEDLEHTTPIEGDHGLLFEAKKESTARAHKALSKSARVAVWKAFDNRATRSEPAFIKAVQGIASKQRDQLKAALSKEGDLSAVIEHALKSVFDKALDKDVQTALTTPWMLAFKHGFDHAVQVVHRKALTDVLYKEDLGPEWDTINPKFREWIEANGLLRAEGLNDTTEENLRKKIAASLQEGIDAGEGRGKLSNRILDATDDVYDDMDRNRANLIARTESCATVNLGQMMTYKEDGVEKKEWLATQDDRTRDSHTDADGQIVGIDEKFSVGADEMDAPGTGSDAGENCNCRCTILPVIEE